MKKYKYFDNVKKNAVFTNQHCQFCGACNDCLEGVYFEKNGIESVCLECLSKLKASVFIPNEIQLKVKNDRDKKVSELSFTPPVAWIQNNEWPVCCDDFMEFIGEWDKEEIIRQSENENYVIYFEKMLEKETLNRIEDLETLIDDLGYDSVAYVFRCVCCKKLLAVCQDY